jgi:cytoskeleton protein RodZ
LRAARERLEWDLEAIAAHLRIRPSVLSAIEEGSFGDMPAGAYTVGFLRTYACALGLDANEVTRRFRAEAAELTRKPDLVFPAPVPERGVPVGAAVLLGAVLVVGAYVGWYNLSAGRPGEEPVRAVPQRLADLVQPPPAPLPVQVVAPGVIAELPPPPMTLPFVPPTSAAAAIPATGVFGPPLATTPVPLGAGLPPLPEGTRIVLRAKADSWLQVRDRQGPVLLNRVLRAGETWPVPPGKQPGQLLLTTGNAGGTEVLVDGQLAVGLGNDGAVRRDLPLDPDAIRDGRLAPPVVAVRTPVPKR